MRFAAMSAPARGHDPEREAPHVRSWRFKSGVRPYAALWAEGAVIAVFMLISYRIPRLKKWTAAGLGTLSLVIYVMRAMAVFNRWLVWLPAAVPLGAVLVFVPLGAVTPDSAGRPKRPVIF